MEKIKDEILYEEFVKGDTKSLEEIYNRYRENLVQFSKSIVQNQDTAEEIVQDIFVNICSKPEKYNEKYTLKSFLFMLCYRKSLTYIKVSNRRSEIEEQYFKVAENFKQTDLSDKLVKKEDIEVIKNSIKLLKLEYRIVLELTEFQGLSTREASIILNKSENATKTLKCRAKDSLEKIIRKKYTYTAKSYKKNLLQIIIICLCIAAVSAGAVYATIKVVETAFKNAQFFKLNDYNKEVEMKGDYITKEQAIEKITYYLQVLGYNNYDLSSTALYKDIMKENDYWRYMNDDVEIRIEANSGKINEFCYCGNLSNRTNNTHIDEIDNKYLEDLCIKLGINLNYKNLEFESSNLDVNQNIIPYIIITCNNKYQNIVIKYSMEMNCVIDLRVKNISFNGKSMQVIKEDDAKDIINNAYEVKEFISFKFEKVEVNNFTLTGYKYNESQKTTSSKEMREAWEIIFKAYNDNIIKCYVDCITGEIIEVKTKI